MVALSLLLRRLAVSCCAVRMAVYVPYSLQAVRWQRASPAHDKAGQCRLCRRRLGLCAVSVSRVLSQ